MRKLCNPNQDKGHHSIVMKSNSFAKNEDGHCHKVNYQKMAAEYMKKGATCPEEEQASGLQRDIHDLPIPTQIFENNATYLEDSDNGEPRMLG